MIAIISIHLHYYYELTELIFSAVYLSFLGVDYLADDSCHALCCNSLYIGSEFCSDTPLRCS